MNLLPLAKSSGIAVQHLGKELLIYDLKTNRAYTLNETSMLVFDYCDGVTSFDDLKRKHKFTDDLIYLTLDELKKNDLLEDYESDHFAGLSRREAVKRVGLASMIALPVIAGLVAPSAASAASAEPVCGTSCTCSVGNTSAGLRFCEYTGIGGLSGVQTGCNINVPNVTCECFVAAGGFTGTCQSITF